MEKERHRSTAATNNNDNDNDLDIENNHSNNNIRRPNTRWYCSYIEGSLLASLHGTKVDLTQTDDED